MKKKTRKMLKRTARGLAELMPSAANGGGTALTMLAAGGLVAAVARDPQLRERGRQLAHAALDRAFGLLSPNAAGPVATGHDDGDPETGPESRDWGAARAAEH